MKMPKSILLHTSFVLLLLCAVSAFAVRPEKVLLSFNFTNGDYPQGLSMDASGNLWTVQSFGGSGTCPDYGPGCGTVVELAPVSGGWKPKIVYNFRGGNDGNRPTGNLVFDAQGNIYGVTVYGGSPNCQCGTVYKLTPVSGGWKESVIYRFNETKNRNDGMYPWAGLIMDDEGNLYGTTESGGNGCSLFSCGTVFELSPTANGTWTEAILYNFKGFEVGDGQYPSAPLVLDAEGNLYGTTYWGGPATYGQCSLGGGGCGVVFELSLNGSGGWTESLIHIFSSGDGDGFYPFAGLIVDASGNLYGTTTSGGFFSSCDNSFYCGTVFELSPASGGAWTETLLHSFSGSEGSSPQSALTADASGNLYGTTSGGGVYNAGIAFELSPKSGGGWEETVLHSFGNGHDGLAPETALVLDASGNLFSSTPYGGADVTGSCASLGCGTVFEIMP